MKLCVSDIISMKQLALIFHLIHFSDIFLFVLHSPDFSLRKLFLKRVSPFTAITALLLLISLSLSAQKHGNYWYFGRNAGIKFTNGTPEVLFDGAIDNFEGVASISDYYGNLLFYTDGITIYNRTHNVMENGNDLKGHPSSTQSGVIIPIPGDADRFIVFTVDYAYSGGDLYYSVVDMKQAGGQGAVVTKNVFLQSNSAEKISAVSHSNHSDIWVVIHERESTEFKSYLITAAGVSSEVKSSFAGQILTSGVQGYLKFSTDGRYLAMATYHERRVDVFNFNPGTGDVGFHSSYSFPDATYGVEFSGDSQFLYASVSYDLKQIHQINLGQKTSTLIASTGMAPGCLQMAPDGKIYVARYNRPDVFSRYLGVIHNPNEEGAACNYVDEYLSLGANRGSLMGLPTFIQSFFVPAVTLNGMNSCLEDTVHFSANLFGNLLLEHDWVLWDFGDPGSPDNTSDILYAQHRFAAPGNYTITFIISSGGSELEASMEIEIYPMPQTDLPDTLKFCEGDSATLTAGEPGYNYLWSNGLTSPAINVTASGKYWVRKMSEFGCSVSDTANIVTIPGPEIDLLGSYIICPDSVLVISAGDDQFTYQWIDMLTSSTRTIADPGFYSVKKTGTSGCYSEHSFLVDHFYVPELSLGVDTLLCSPGGIDLIVSGFESYLWNDGSNSPVYHVDTPGIYSLVAFTADRCSAADSLMVSVCCEFSLVIPNVFTPNHDGINDTFKPVLHNAGRYKMTIANRWGVVLFETNDPEEGWDGYFMNERCPTGVYYVVFDIERCTPEGLFVNKKTHGSVTLLY